MRPTPTNLDVKSSVPVPTVQLTPTAMNPVEIDRQVIQYTCSIGKWPINATLLTVRLAY